MKGLIRQGMSTTSKGYQASIYCCEVFGGKFARNNCDISFICLTLKHRFRAAVHIKSTLNMFEVTVTIEAVGLDFIRQLPRID